MVSATDIGNWKEEEVGRVTDMRQLVTMPKQDLRVLKPVFVCGAEGEEREEECLFYAPGPSGRCGFLSTVFCSKEGFNLG